jgi:predicted SAM-dependent methyltransferase
MITQTKKLIKKMLGIHPWEEDEKSRIKMVDFYFSKNNIRKIQFGCGPNQLENWLNTDIYKSFDGVVYLDITKELCFPSNSVDFMTSEHLIEHISYNDALFFLNECFRVLKTNGVIRITTPNLATLLALYSNHTDNMESKYIEHIVRNFLPDVKNNKEVFVINNAFRNWGHQFLYDKGTLINVLTKIGFTEINELEPGMSQHEALKNVDVRNKSEFSNINKFEVMVFEAKKP